MGIVALIIACVAGVLSWMLYDQHMNEKIKKQSQENMRVRHFLIIDINRIIENHKYHIIKNNIKYVSSYGCVLKLQLEFRNGKSIQILCSETYFLKVNEDELNYEQHCRDDIKTYIASQCETKLARNIEANYGNNVAFLENYRQRA